MEIFGVTHPIPKKYCERIYNQGKNVFVGKKHLGKAKSGSKFIIYESRGVKAYTGWGDIISIQKMKTDEIIPNFKNQLMITPNELKEYAQKKPEMNVIIFENFEQFNNPVVPKRFVSIGGKYIYKKEFKMIEKMRG